MLLEMLTTAAIPTNSATSIRMLAIVVPADVRLAETAAMNDIVPIMRTTAMAMT